MDHSYGYLDLCVMHIDELLLMAHSQNSERTKPLTDEIVHDLFIPNKYFFIWLISCIRCWGHRMLEASCNAHLSHYMLHLVASCARHPGAL